MEDEDNGGVSAGPKEVLFRRHQLLAIDKQISWRFVFISLLSFPSLQPSKQIERDWEESK